MANDQTLLQVRELTRTFGALVAVNKVNLSVGNREVRALIGPNGAGKSTLFKMIAGKLPPVSGEIFFEGRNVTGLKPAVMYHLGLVPTFQVAHIFTNLSVIENVLIGIVSRQKQTLRIWRSIAGAGFSQLWDEAGEILDRVGMLHMAYADSGTLSLGDRKRLEIAIALAGHPRLLLLDEPTAGMSLPERHRTVALLQKLSGEMDSSVLFTEHDMDVVFNFSHRITVLHHGQIIAEGKPDEIRNDELVRAAYLGTSAERGTG